MDFEKDQLEEWFQKRLTRRDALKRAAVVGAGLSLGPMLIASPGDVFAKSPDVVRWISPRGSLDVMDDFDLWVAIKEGFFAKHNIKAELFAGSITDALDTTKEVAAGKADMGYPSPGVLTSSIDGGIPVISAWEMIAGQVFDFSLPENSKIKSPKQLEGKTIAVGSAGWSVIIAPILKEVGVHPKSVKYFEAGSQWSVAVEQGKADAGLCWEGLRAQLIGQGLKLKFLIGSTFSKGPSNSYAIRKADLKSAKMRDIYTRFFMAMVEAFEFTKVNPRASAQITYVARPALASTLSPQLALNSMMELASGYSYSARQGHGYGYHYISAWKNYLKIVHELKQTTRLLTPKECVTNTFVNPANSGADVSEAHRKAKKFKLNSQFAHTKIPSHEPL
jgi:NitT/TauT family transport system substrate-binding protein